MILSPIDAYTASPPKSGSSFLFHRHRLVQI
jgi:hypothetical protein